MRAPSGKLTRNHVICKNIAKFRPWKPCGFTFKIMYAFKCYAVTLTSNALIVAKKCAHFFSLTYRVTHRFL